MSDVMSVVRNALVGALAGGFLGLLVAITAIPTAMNIGFSGNTLVTTIVALGVISAMVGATLGAVLLPIFALLLPRTSAWKIARHAVIGGLIGVMVCTYVAGFFRPRWTTDASLVGAVLGSSTAVALMRRARRRALA